MLDVFMDAVSDFPGTVVQVESGHCAPKPQREHEGDDEQRLPTTQHPKRIAQMFEDN
jgi:hypothetical protein